jgi:hypothetical protein
VFINVSDKRALKKLVDYKNAAAISVSIITNKLQEECDGNMFAENYNKYHCANCYNGIIRKDCFQVKSNLLTVDNLVFHF